MDLHYFIEKLHHKNTNSLSNLSQNMYNFKSLLTYINIVINIDMCAYYYQYLRNGAHRSIYRLIEITQNK